MEVNKIMKKAEAEIHVEIFCECPHCERTVDLTECDESHTAMSHAFGDGHWGCENAEMEVTCKHCSENFQVDKISW